jgi:hypothetical protein
MASLGPYRGISSGGYDWETGQPLTPQGTVDYQAQQTGQASGGQTGGVPNPFGISGGTTQQVAAANLNSKNKSSGTGSYGATPTSEAATRGTSGPGGAATSASMAMPWQSSNEWFGGLDEYGGIAAANNPGVFWDLYGTEQLGLEAGSATGAFMNENYNPYALAKGFGVGGVGMDDRLAQGTWLAQQLGQPGMTFFDPGQLVTSVLSQLATAGNGGGGSQFGELSSLVGPGMTPDQQLSNIIDFLGEALKSAMPADTLSAYLNWLSAIGMQIINDVMTSKAQGGGLAEFERGGKNMATALMARVGPNGGL